MKFLHWVIFALAFWIILVPFIGDDIFFTSFPNSGISQLDLIHMLRWDDLFLGLAIAIMALVVVTVEQPNLRTAGLRAMHWMQFGLGTWVATAPFALEFGLPEFAWSHFVTGFFIGIFALIQINLEGAKH